MKLKGINEKRLVKNLPRENEGNVQINIDVKIKVNKDGVFQGVIQGDKTISIQDWNKQFESNGN